MPNKTNLSDDQIADIIKKKRAGTIATTETKPPTKKPGSKSASIEATMTATSPEISEMIGNVLYWYNRQPVKTDEDVADRLNEFFQHVHETGEIPTVEKMCLALGVHRQTVWQWKTGQGCSTTRTYMIKKAYDVMGALDAEMVSRNKIPQVTYIFRAKNFYGLTDTQQVIVTPNSPLDQANADEARKKYIQALPEITGNDE